MLLLESKRYVEKDFIEIDNNLINYTVSGYGEPLILIHGLGTSIDSWSLNIKELSKFSRVYAIDLPGFGESISNDQILTSEELAGIVAKFCEKLGINNAHFVGHSFGGEVCLWVSVKYPKLVKSTILAASTGLCNHISDIEKFKNLMRDGVREPIFFLPKLFKSYSKAGLWRMFLTMHKSKIRNLCNYVSKIKNPVLAIYGSRDPVIVPEEDKRALKKIKNKQVEIINSTHGLIFDNPKKFNSLVINFITALN